MKKIMFFLTIMALSLPLFAGKADILKVKIQKTGDNTYTFYITMKHNDEGWQHYADRWEILDVKGNVLAVRILHHPHVTEQPFTRSLSNVVLPVKVTRVIIRGHDSVHGYGGKTVTIDL